MVAALVEHGGKVVDTWPRNADNDAAFGRILARPDWSDRPFVTINLDQAGAREGVDQFERTLRAYQRDSLDLVNVGSLIDLDARWPSFEEWKATGRARYIGVTAAQAALYDRLESFLRTAAPDFVEINYSVTERDAEQRLLPLLADRGIAVPAVTCVLTETTNPEHMAENVLTTLKPPADRRARERMRRFVDAL